jgi:hypothetical protein
MKNNIHNVYNKHVWNYLSNFDAKIPESTEKGPQLTDALIS